jgi:hypothetical protein
MTLAIAIRPPFWHLGARHRRTRYRDLTCRTLTRLSEPPVRRCDEGACECSAKFW